MNSMMICATAMLLVVPISVPALDDVPAIRSGCSGGITGGGGGYEIRGNGDISSWSMESRNSAPESTLIRSDKPAADRLFAMFERAGFVRIEHHEPGNMTCFLTLSSAGKSHTVVWSQKPPQRVRELTDAVAIIATGKPVAVPGELTIVETIPAPTPDLKLEEKLPAPNSGP